MATAIAVAVLMSRGNKKTNTRIWDPAHVDMLIPTTDRKRSLEIGRAQLMIQRGQIREARKLLERLRRSGPLDPDVEDLLADIASRQENDQAIDENRRAWRYWLNLNTSWRRLVWGVSATVSLMYGLYCAGAAAPVVMKKGLNASITTRVYRGSRYRRGRWVDWTRPIYYDLLYGGVFVMTGVIMIVVLVGVSRGAADWEELDVTDNRRW